ncbi:hypothetical protein L0F63_000822, partial [Massospora cicadina]
IAMDLESNPESPEIGNDSLDGRDLKRGGLNVNAVKGSNYPEGGYGWIIVIAGFIIYALVPGILMSIGVVIRHYSEIWSTKTNTTTLAFVGSVANSIFSILAVISGGMIDHFGHCVALIIGAILFSGGLFLASFAEESWHLFLTLGILSGVGDSLITISVISAPAMYFYKRLGVASGFIMAGYGIGGFFFSTLITRMIAKWDIKTTLQILSVASFSATFALSFCYYRRSPFNKRAHGFGVLRKPRFQILFASAFISSIGYLIPFILIPKYAETKGIDNESGSFLLGLLNGSTSIGRIILGPCADQVGRLNMMLFSSIATCLCCLIWAFSSNYLHMVIFVICYGITGGSFLSILSVAARQLYPDESVPNITGLIYFSVGLPYLAGPPLAEELSRLFSSSVMKVDNYVPAIVLTGGFPLIAFFPLAYLRFDLESSWKKRI